CEAGAWRCAAGIRGYPLWLRRWTGDTARDLANATRGRSRSDHGAEWCRQIDAAAPRDRVATAEERAGAGGWRGCARLHRGPAGADGRVCVPEPVAHAVRALGACRADLWPTQPRDGRSHSRGGGPDGAGASRAERFRGPRAAVALVRAAEAAGYCGSAEHAAARPGAG